MRREIVDLVWLGLLNNADDIGRVGDIPIMELKRNAFLVRVWRDGALFGATPQEAFYVKCDAENNPSEVIDAGQLVVEVGIAPVKPAEFVIFRIAQFSGGASLME